MALTWASAGTREFTQARAVRPLVEALTAKSRVPFAVVVEMTPKAPVPELDHCDQPPGKLPKAVELKVSRSQGDADGASRGSKNSSCGTTLAGAFLFMDSLEVWLWVACFRGRPTPACGIRMRPDADWPRQHGTLRLGFSTDLRRDRNSGGL
jgi:hypothetical protein